MGIKIGFKTSLVKKLARPPPTHVNNKPNMVVTLWNPSYRRIVVGSWLSAKA
jgi:hypothetical protein